RAVARVGSLTEWPRSRESLAVDNAEVDELAPEIELHRAPEEVAADCRARLDRPLGVDRARDPELERAAVFVLDVREQLRLQIAADDQAVEVLVDLEDAEQRRVDPAGQGGGQRRAHTMPRERLAEAVGVDHRELIAERRDLPADPGQLDAEALVAIA